MTITQDNSITSLSNGLSVGAWIYITQNRDSKIISQWGSREQYLFYIYNNKINVNTDGDGAGFVSYDISNLYSQWIHVLFTMDNNILRLYLNGSEVATDSSPNGSFMAHIMEVI